MAGRLHVFQIFYDAESRAAVDPHFEPLDNSGSARPDWYEYWPIRSFLASHALDESVHYGFLSPRFFAKTRLSGKQVLDFALRATHADVITFSPHPCHAAVFYNVFEQAANFFPGFLDVARAFLHELDPSFRLEQLVNHSGNTVYSNFFLARARFWREWSAVCDRLFQFAEGPPSPLREALNRATVYVKDDGETKPAQMKVMLMERIAPLLLSSGAFRIANYDTFAMPLSRGFAGYLQELRELDALKIAYAASSDAAALRRYMERRDALLAKTSFGVRS